MKIKAFKITQWGYGEGVEPTILYLTAMRAEDVVKRSFIDRWSRENRDGYQRPPVESRFGSGRGSITRYLLSELGSFPTSILLNTREDIKFNPISKISETIEFGDLEIPENVKFSIIDGQHRIEALKRAMMTKHDLKDYPLPISLLNLKEKFDEMLHFYIVNSRQRKIETNLAYKHLQQMLQKVIKERKAKWLTEIILSPSQVRKALAAFVVDELQENPKSPFYHRIQFLGEPQEEYHLTTDFKLTTYIAKILKEKTFEGMGTKDFAELLMEYWSAIKELYPKCFKEPQRYSLLKTTGIAAFMYLFPTIYAYCAREGNVSKDGMKQLLSNLKMEIKSDELEPDFQRPIDEDWWSIEHGPSIAHATGEKMFNIIFTQFAKKIELARAT